MIPYDQVYGQGIEDMLHRAPSIEKIHEAIGWQPTRTFEQTLADVVDFVRRDPLLVDAAVLES